MGDILIPNVDDSVIWQLEKRAEAMHLSLGECLKQFLMELAAPTPPHHTPLPDNVAGSLQRYAPEYISLEVARERLTLVMTNDADHCR
ncbi:MAG: hypothetical protein HQL56_15725 [Magnetococcales bacterium]|nr:hypothetical protein [Magnetococcales bacterium]